jgi:hypothetical protein
MHEEGLEVVLLLMQRTGGAKVNKRAWEATTAAPPKPYHHQTAHRHLHAPPTPPHYSLHTHSGPPGRQERLAAPHTASLAHPHTPWLALHPHQAPTWHSTQ